MAWVVDQYEAELAQRGHLMVTGVSRVWAHKGCEKGGSWILSRDILVDGKNASMGSAEFRCSACRAATLPRPDSIGIGVQPAPSASRGFGFDPGGQDFNANHNWGNNAQGKAGEDGRWS
jgi:hypothetical protein